MNGVSVSSYFYLSPFSLDCVLIVFKHGVGSVSSTCSTQSNSDKIVIDDRHSFCHSTGQCPEQ